jgi:hypothetical protein
VNEKWRAAAFATSSRIATLVAVQHPKRGDVSSPTPGAVGTALRKTRLGHRFTQSTLFAILQLQLLQPALNLRDCQPLLKYLALGIPFSFGEVDRNIVLSEIKRKL